MTREVDPEAQGDDASDDQHVYRLTVDTAASSELSAEVIQSAHPAAHFEMVSAHGHFWSFRAPMAHDRFLQGTRRAACRLRFCSDKCGTWEEWAIDEDESDDLRAPWARRDVTFRHRRLEKLELRVTLVRLGHDAVPGARGSTGGSIGGGAEYAETQIPNVYPRIPSPVS